MPLWFQNVSKVNLLSKEWCNLVFEHRNKEYGAYVLRRNGGAMLTRALVIVVVGFVLVAVVPLLLFEWQLNWVRKEADSVIANLSKLDPPKVKHERELKAVDISQRVMARRVKKSIKFVPEISADEDADAQLRLGTDDVGKSDDAEALEAVPDSIVTNDSAFAGSTVDTQLPSPVEVVEEMPQFPGGLAALMKWLDKNVVYPPSCIRNKIEGRVEVAFYVSKEGKVMEPRVVKKLHPLLDREALLTVKKMPNWTPGRVDGKVSVVRITIPIEFSCDR